jgi:transcriptional/translational regulatory protein YebC/TACO1
VDDVTLARKVVAFIEELDDHDDVQNVWTNHSIPDETLAAIGSA